MVTLPVAGVYLSGHGVALWVDKGACADSIAGAAESDVDSLFLASED